MQKKSKSREEVESPLEVLRLSYTDLTQDEFCVACGIPRTTYQRINRNAPEKMKLTIEQIYKICRVCKISADKFLSILMESLPTTKND